MSDGLNSLLAEVRACQLCKDSLPLGPNPVLRAKSSARILIVGQAPGTKVHNSGVPWNDASGINLRDWMEIPPDEFYDESRIAIIPMGFCYPGKGKSGDLPPRKECAPQWHKPLLQQLGNIKLTLLVGSYAIKYYLGKKAHPTLTETVRNYQEYLPTYFPLVHPSPRNGLWQSRNPWFRDEVIPSLRNQVLEALA